MLEAPAAAEAAHLMAEAQEAAEAAAAAERAEAAERAAMGEEPFDGLADNQIVWETPFT